jgi:hypothetical protein
VSDAAGDSDRVERRRRWSDEQKLLAVIPNHPSRAIKHPLDKHLYAPTRRMLLQQTQAKIGVSPRALRRPRETIS